MAEPARVVIVTGGGGGGCGRAVASRFGATGAAVVVTDIDHAAGAATVRSIEGSGSLAAFVPADVRDNSQMKELIAFAERRFGGLDVLVNNATAAHGSEAIESWMDSIETDLLGALHATRWAIEAMRRGRGGLS